MESYIRITGRDKSGALVYGVIRENEPIVEALRDWMRSGKSILSVNAISR